MEAKEQEHYANVPSPVNLAIHRIRGFWQGPKGPLVAASTRWRSRLQAARQNSVLNCGSAMRDRRSRPRPAGRGYI